MDKSGPQSRQHFFIRLIGTINGWPENMTTDEKQIMSDHFEYLRELTLKRKVIAAGPVFDPVFGMIILQSESEKEARHIMDNEPSVVQGIHTYEISPMRVSLLVDHIPRERYPAETTDRILRKDVIVPAGSDAVWEAWTTGEGARTFFSEGNMIDLRPGGPYEIYFDHNAEYGRRGSEGCRVLSFLPRQMLSFEWNAPPDFGPLRDLHTQVIVQLDEIDTELTRVILTQTGWGGGADWDRLYDYFDRAWEYVLGNLKKRFEVGPLDWS